MGETRRSPSGFLLTVIVPVYNEERSIVGVLEKLTRSLGSTPSQILVVNDGSTDQTLQLALEASENLNQSGEEIIVVSLAQNSGKGAAVLKGISSATGTHCLIFDGDNEYDPNDIKSLVRPVTEGKSDVVFGVRLQGINTKFISPIHLVGNRVMTKFANLLFGSVLSDMHSCLKLFPMSALAAFTLHQRGFGLDTELVCKLLKHGHRPYEVPVSYVARSKQDGKKIKLSDAFASFFIMVSVRLRKS